MNIVEPHLPEAEENIIGCILDNPEKAIQVMSILEVEDFSQPSQRTFFRAITDIVNSGKEATYMTIKDWLDTTESSYSVAELDKVSDDGGIESGLEGFCRVVKEKSTLRKILRVCRQKYDESFVYTGDIQKFIGSIQDHLYDISIDHSNKTKQNLVTGPKQWSAKCLEDFERKCNKDPNDVDTSLVLSKYEQLEEHTYGASDLGIISAFTSGGKSLVSLNLAIDYAIKQKIPTLYLNYEMSEQDITNRIVSIITGVHYSLVKKGITYQDIEKGLATERDKYNIVEALKRISEDHPLYLTDNRGKDINTSVSLVEKYVISSGIKVLFVDYIGIVGDDSLSLKTGSEYTTWGRYVRAFKDVCTKHGIKLWVLAQQAKGENKFNIDGIQGSVKLIQDAETVLILLKDDQKGKTFIKLAKNRQGRADMVWELPVNHENFRLNTNWIESSMR